jgi:hypothetical protein
VRLSPLVTAGAHNKSLTYREQEELIRLTTQLIESIDTTLWLPLLCPCSTQEVNVDTKLLLSQIEYRRDFFRSQVFLQVYEKHNPSQQKYKRSSIIKVAIYSQTGKVYALLFEEE